MTEEREGDERALERDGFALKLEGIRWGDGSELGNGQQRPPSTDDDEDISTHTLTWVNGHDPRPNAQPRSLCHRRDARPQKSHAA